DLGLLTYWSLRAGGLPVYFCNSGSSHASPLAAYSGATVRGFHPLPFSLANGCEHLRLKRVDANKKGKKRSTSFSWLGVASNLRPPRSTALSATDPHPACGHPLPKGEGEIHALARRLQDYK